MLFHSYAGEPFATRLPCLHLLWRKLAGLSAIASYRVNTVQMAASRNDAARAGSGYRYPIGLAADGGAGPGALEESAAALGRASV